MRKKNVLGTMMQSFAMMAIITVLWALVGYSLASERALFVGGFHYLLLSGVDSMPNADYARRFRSKLLWCINSCSRSSLRRLITGAFAERMKFSAMLLFMMLWALFVYFPMAHMVWGKGGLLNAFLGGKIPCLISPEARWSISLRAFRRWFARCILASALDIRQA